MADNPTFQIPKDVIEPIIQAHVNDAVIQALGGHREILTKAIAWTMNIQVDNSGKPTTYNGIPWITWAVQESVRRAARNAIEAFLGSHEELIKKQIAAELGKKNSPLVRQLIEAMVGNMTNKETLQWRLSVSCDSLK